MNNKTYIIINIILLAVAIAGLTASAYGIGKQEVNKDGDAYTAATTFMGISLILVVIFIISLLILVLISSGGVKIDQGAGYITARSPGNMTYV